MLTQHTNKDEITMIEIQHIIEPRLAMRNKFTTNSIASLVESIRRIGLINPLTVKARGLDFEIIAGHRRYCAIKLLHWSAVPCIIKTPAGLEELSIRYDENSERAAVDVIEEAEYLQSILDEHKITQSALAQRIGKQPAYVSERLAILAYHPQILAALKNGSVTFSVAREFAKIESEEALLQYLSYAIANGCTPATARLWRKQIAATKQWQETSAQIEPDENPPEDTPPSVPFAFVKSAMNPRLPTNCDPSGVARHATKRLLHVKENSK